MNLDTVDVINRNQINGALDGEGVSGAVLGDDDEFGGVIAVSQSGPGGVEAQVGPRDETRLSFRGRQEEDQNPNTQQIHGLVKLGVV